MEEAQELRDGIGRVTLRLIEELGHTIPSEQPEALAAAIVLWLRERATPHST